MKWIDEIFIEAARTFAQAARITFALFWWLALAVVALARKSGFHLRDYQLRGPGGSGSEGQIEGKRCAVCGAENEASASYCFNCGQRL